MKSTEKRDFVRQPVNLTTELGLGHPLRIQDISENGFGGVVDKNLGIKSGEVAIPLSEKEKLKTGFTVKWSRVKDFKQIRYGAKFTSLDINAQLNIRKLIIENSIKKFLDKIQNTTIKRKVINFWFKEFLTYWQESDDLKKEMKKNRLNQDLIQRSEKLNRKILEKAEDLTKDIDEKEVIKSIREVFRFLTGTFFYKSSFFEKSLTKPRGYPGDFEMMEIIYNNCPASMDVIGQYADKFYLNNPYAEAVRNRKDKMVEILEDIFLHTKASSLNILNIACGSCREIKELFTKRINLNCKVHYVCIDHDQEAIDFAKGALNGILSKHRHLNVKFIKEDVLKLIRKQDNSENKLGEYDVVYSIGLADYLSDRLLKRMIQFSYNSLKPGGTVIIAHKIEKNDPYAPVTPKWICDWVFHARNVDDLLELIENSGIQNYSAKNFIWDSSQRIIFIPIRKD